MSSIASSALARRSRSSGSSNHSSSTRTALLIATANASVGRINGREGTGGSRCSALVVPPARRDPPQTGLPELPGRLLDRMGPQVKDTPGTGEAAPRTPNVTARELAVTELGGRHWPLLRPRQFGHRLSESHEIPHRCSICTELNRRITPLKPDFRGTLLIVACLPN